MFASMADNSPANRYTRSLADSKRSPNHLAAGMNTKHDATAVPAPLPTLAVSGTPESIVSRLDAAAKRGKLAGFSTTSDGLFQVTDFGGPFESMLIGRAVPDGATTRVGFELRLKSRLAWVYLIVLVATVWPGVWLTDSMLRTYFTGYDYQTWMWYLPLTAPFVPWAMWASVRKSRRAGREAAIQIISDIAAHLGAAAPSPTASAAANI